MSALAEAAQAQSESANRDKAGHAMTSCTRAHPQPTEAEIHKACTEIFAFQMASLERLAEMARPFLSVETEFAEALAAYLREQLPLNSEDEISGMAGAILVVAHNRLPEHACH